MSQFDASASAIAALAAFNTAYAEASANNGEGGQGEWPPSGSHNCTVTGITIKMEQGKEFNDKNTPGGAKLKLDGVFVQFLYRCDDLFPGQKDPTQPLDWKGASFFIPTDPSKCVGKNDWMIRMPAERLKGHLRIINGADNPNIQAALTQALSTINSRQVHVEVDIQERPGSQTAEQKASGKPAPVYKTEFLKQLLA